MAGKLYVLANLTDEQLNEVKEAEQTLVPGIEILAYKAADADVARLNPSQLECLQGLEQKLGLTLVVYRKD